MSVRRAPKEGAPSGWGDEGVPSLWLPSPALLVYSDGHSLVLLSRRVFVPSYTSRVLVEVLRCRGAEGCPLWLRVRAKAPPLHNSTTLDCREHTPCQLAQDLPFWQHWYYVLVEKHPGVPGTISFQVTVQLTGEGACGGVGGLDSALVWGLKDAHRNYL